MYDSFFKIWGYQQNNSVEHLSGLFVPIFFASKAGKKGFPLLSRSSSSVNLFSTFIMQ
jgi:hypothetical protein